MDVATKKTTQLAANGAGWVDFARALRTIIFSASGLGELLRLDGTAASCRNYSLNVSVPVGRDHLAATVAGLDDVLRKRGNRRQTPWRIVEDIYWYEPDQTLEPCKCKPRSSAGWDRVQVFLPASFPRGWGLRSPARLAPGGAVLFGHSWEFPLRWKKGPGPPEEGAKLEDELRAVDSGIGSSLSSSGGGQGASFPRSTSSVRNSGNSGAPPSTCTSPRGQVEGLSCFAYRHLSEGSSDFVDSPAEAREAGLVLGRPARDGGQSEQQKEPGLAGRLFKRRKIQD